MKELLEKIQIWGLATLVFLLPVFFLPFTTEFFDFNKTALLVFGVLILTTVYFLHSLLSGEIRLRISPFDLPVLAFAAAAVLATALRTPAKMDAFLFPGTTTIILAGTLLYFLVIQIVRYQISDSRLPDVRLILWALLGSGLILSLVSIAASTGLIEKIPQLPAYMRFRTFSLTGAPLPAVTFLLLLLPIAIGFAIREYAKRKTLTATLYSLLSTFFILSIVAVAFHLLPGKPASPRILPPGFGWSIAVETLKNSPILGVGPANFVSAFNQYKPISYNLTDIWNLRFGASSNWYLHILTEVGILGLGTFLFLGWRLVRIFGLRFPVTSHQSPDTSNWILYSLYLILILFLLIPANFLLLVTFYLLLGLVAAPMSSETTLKLQAIGIRGQELGIRGTRLLPTLFLILTSLFTLVVFYLGGRAYLAEVNFRRALEAAARNEGTNTYNLLIATIRLNPFVDRYRITYAQTNLALANAIAQKTEISDQDRAIIAQLVQQAIREGKAAVALNPARSQNWENLARIYRNLLPFATGADQWAIATFSQAVALEPVNPNIRISLGGVYFALGRYDEAIRAFELAAASKPDLANAHFNLAVALREKGDTQRAISEMERTLALVSPGSADYQTAQAELENLRKKLGQAPGFGETLVPPPPAPEPVIQPPLELPAEASPPATP